MTPARLASWITIITIVGCLGCAWNEETTLGRYQAFDAEGNTIRYLVAEGPRGTGYTVARAVYPQFVEEPEQVTAISIKDFQRLKKWLKEEKGNNMNMQKEPD